MKMKLRILNDAIYDENGNIVGVVSPDANESIRKTIEAGSDAIKAIKKFVFNANRGSFKPKASVKEFEDVLNKNEIPYD